MVAMPRKATAGRPRRKRHVLAAIGLLLLSSGLTAEMSMSVELDSALTLAVNPDPQEAEGVLLGSGSAQLSLDATGNRDVRASLRLNADMDNVSDAIANIAVERAYIRARFEHWRVTAGKTRVSWGEGLVFNAADLLLGAADLEVNLSEQEYRDQSRFLTAGYIPLGSFSFAEVLISPAELTYEQDELTTPEIQESSAGVRLGGEIPSLGDVAVEGGYLYDGDDELNRSYVSLQGGAGLNWHLSASSALSTSGNGGSAGNQLYDNLLISAGLYGLPNVGRAASLSLRTEVMVKPAAAGNELAGHSDYRVFVYGEASLGFNASSTVYFRSIVSPIDRSALLLAGGETGFYQGMSVYGYALWQIGDGDDVYTSAEVGGVAALIGMRLVY